MKLRRPKPFLAGQPQNHIVNGTPVILANLYGAAAIPVQTVILIAIDDEWQEIKLTLPGSNIDDFVKLCNDNGTHLFSVTEKSKVFVPETPKEICERLATDKHSAADIMLLWNHVTRFGRISYYDDMRGWMKRVTGTIPEYIEYLKQQEIKFNYEPKMKYKHELVAEGRGADYEYSIGVMGSEKGYNYYFDIHIGDQHKEVSTKDSKFGFLKAIHSSIEDSLYYLRFLITSGFQHPDLNKIFTEIQNHLKTNTMARQLSERELELIDLGFTLDKARNVYTLGDFTIQQSTIESIEYDAWVAMIGRISSNTEPDNSAPVSDDFNDFETISETVSPAPASPTTSITLESISTLHPDSISDLQGLKSKQEAIVIANPFIAVTDSKSLKKAKTAKAALLKASTETEKIETNASKYLNTFKAMIKSIVTPAAQITRDPHQKQADEITRYEKAEEIRLADLRKQEIDRINNRTTRLFAIPMVFNGELYSIGTLYVTPSQIQTATDEEFESWIVQGNAIKSALDSSAQAQKSKDDMIAELQAKLAALNAPAVEVSAPPAPVSAPVYPVSAPDAPVVFNGSESNTVHTSVIPPVEPPQPPPVPEASNGKWQPETIFAPAATNDYIMAKFDMDNMEHVKAVPMNPNFIKARSYFRNGRLETATAIRMIMEGASTRKAAEVMELVSIIEQQ